MCTEIMIKRVELNQMSWKMLSRQNRNLCHNKYVPASGVGDNRKLHQTLHFLPSGDVGVVVFVSWQEISYIRKIQICRTYKWFVPLQAEFAYFSLQILWHFQSAYFSYRDISILFLLTRANRQIRVMHGGMCILLTWFSEFVGDRISRPAGISYLLQAATWKFFSHPTVPIKGVPCLPECQIYFV